MTPSPPEGLLPRETERITLPAAFVIITPARNEERFIGRTIESMIAQTVRPVEWVIVNDGSTDRTSEIVAGFAAEHAFIKLVDVARSGERHFGNKARAFNLGLGHCSKRHYEFIGNIDADVSFDSDYFENVLLKFARDPQLGIAGGMVASRIGKEFVSQDVAFDSVAGAVQLFRRSCFEEIGGYLELPRGGIDSAAEITARMRGWGVRTFTTLRVLEHRQTGTATGSPLASRVKEGGRFHSLGYGPLFLFFRCLYRSTKKPRVVGSCATLLGYVQAAVRGDPIALPPEAIRYLRNEQRDKLLRRLRLRTR